MTFCCISIDYGDGYLSAKTQFWIWNLSGFIGYEGLHLFLPFLLEVPSQGKVLPSNQEFYVRKPVLEPRIPKIHADNLTLNDFPLLFNIAVKVTSNDSQFIYTKQYKPDKGSSEIPALPSKYWLVEELHELEGLSDNSKGISEFNSSFRGVRKMSEGIQASSSQF